jgi:hypothetical protein
MNHLMGTGAEQVSVRNRVRRCGAARLISAAAIAGLASASAWAQNAIFSNASAIATTPALGPTSTTLSGVSAPAGSQWSEVSASSATQSNALAGISGQSYLAGTYRFADDFTIGAGHTWQVGGVSVYAYQPNASASASPFATLNMRIWQGVPGAQGSTIVWGDTTTNRLAGATSTGIYRVFNTSVAPGTAPDQSRLIWQLDASVSVNLPPGTYWLDWQVTSVDPFAEAFSPTVVLPGQRSQASFNAMQFKPLPVPGDGGTWATINDPGKPTSAGDTTIALPFIIRGTSTGCVADFDQSGAVSIDDIFIYINAWFTGDPRCNVDNVPGVSLDDLFVFINIWFAGCP